MSGSSEPALKSSAWFEGVAAPADGARRPGPDILGHVSVRHHPAGRDGRHAAQHRILERPGAVGAVNRVALRIHGDSIALSADVDTQRTSWRALGINIAGGLGA